MNLKELLYDIDLLSKHFAKTNESITPEKNILLRSIKLSEEIGELNQQILLHLGYWSKEKIEKYSQENMEDEMADVIFSALILSRALNIDTDKALSNKMDKIKKIIWI